MDTRGLAILQIYGNLPIYISRAPEAVEGSAITILQETGGAGMQLREAPAHAGPVACAAVVCHTSVPQTHRM
ncbi:hypothetical protein COCOBI_06-6800 [Coccomyxa sp. Obi]|nr:hypothetical protein COCOBI_06-6800 [Coccomyxa sp. Obi]